MVKLIYSALAENRRAPEAIAALRALLEKLDPAIVAAYPTAILALTWYAHLGALDDAYDVAQRMASAFKGTGVLQEINVMPLWMAELLPFRRDPRFQTLAEELRLIVEGAGCAGRLRTQRRTPGR